MAAGIATINLDCPRCDCPIVCDVVTTPLPPKPGAKTADFELSVPKLAEHFAAHYREAHGIAV